MEDWQAHILSVFVGKDRGIPHVPVVVRAYHLPSDLDCYCVSTTSMESILLTMQLSQTGLAKCLLQFILYGVMD